MTKKVNKNITDSDELFGRLENGDSTWLDDFEKEALEGFASLEDSELSRSLHNKLNKEIEKRYFKKEKSNAFFYFSMAAGLILVIGLSVVFFTNIGDKKENIAMMSETKEAEEKLAKEVNMTPPAEMETAKDEAAPEEKSVADKETKSASSDEIKKETGLTPRSVIAPGGVVSKKSAQPADEIASTNEDLKQVTLTNTNAGPPANTAAPVAAEEQKTDESFTGKKTEATITDNTFRDKDQAPAKPSENSNIAKYDTDKKENRAKLAKESDSNRKGKEKRDEAEREGESLQETASKANPDSETKTESVARNDNKNAQGASQGVAVSADDNSGYYKSPQFGATTYSKAKEYVKKEIGKDNLLKKNIKSFKAKLTVNADGKVIKVTLTEKFKDCPACEKLLENILLDMPKWENTKGGKSSAETLDFIYP